MSAGLQVTTAATGEPLTRQEVKDHLRVTSTSQDTVIDNLITSARLWFETETNVTAMDQTYRLTLDDFPASETVDLPRTPLASTSVTITYLPTTGGSATFDSTHFIVDDQSPRPRVALKDEADWPDTDLQRVNGVRVDFTAGFGTSSGPGAVPRLLKQGMLMLAAHWYENRETATVGASVNEVPMSVRNVVWHYRLESVP